MKTTPSSQSSRPSALLRPLVSTIAVAVICLAGAVRMAPTSFATTNGGSITAPGVPLTENFDTLASAGTAIVWTDNLTIAGWWSNRLLYNSGTGSSNIGALYSFGVAGTNPLPDDGRTRLSVDAEVNSSASCPARPYVPFGVWSIVVP